MDRYDKLKIGESLTINVPTYDGTGQAVHPDILYFKNMLLGYKFYFVFTPYYKSNDKLENPSILVSNDGINYNEIVYGMNPLVTPPLTDHNNDPDISYDDSTNKFMIFYLQTERPNKQELVLLDSYDAITWNKKTIISYNLTMKDDFIVSPAITKNNNHYYMYHVVTATHPQRIRYYKTDNPYIWDKNSTYEICNDFPNDFVPWHLDVISSDGKYYMLLSGYTYGQPVLDSKLHLATSSDLINWKYHGIIINNDPVNFLTTIYRSSGFIEGDSLYVWYSCYTRNNDWSIHLKKISLSSLIKL